MSKKKYVIKIITDLDKLSDRANEVLANDGVETISKINNDLKETLRANKDLLCLSATQIGYDKRIIALKFANGDIRCFMNPMVLNYEKKLVLSRETCGSIPDKEFLIPRYEQINVAYQTPMGKAEVNQFSGVSSYLFQQMCQLLDGITLADLGLELLDGWDDLDKDEQQEIIAMYLESLNQIESKLQEEMKTNKEMRDLNNAIDFLTDKALGKVKTEELTEEEQALLEKQSEEIASKKKELNDKINDKINVENDKIND